MKWYVKDGRVAKPYPTLFGYRRRNVFILFGIILVLIVLIIGLAVGLNLRNKSENPPYPPYIP
jgi:hypothetical protein